MSGNEEEKNRFKQLLENETALHGFFCDVDELDGMRFFRNYAFKEDPIFNHFVMAERLLEDPLTTGTRLKQEAEKAKAFARKKKLEASIFIDRIWKKSTLLERSAVEAGYRITNGMEILSRPVHVEEKPELRKKTGIQTEETDDYELWNDIFMSSFSIPETWRDELLERERRALKHSNFHLAVSSHPEANSKAQGCILTLIEPEKLLGIYCVGTLPKWRGRGLARAMVDHCLEQAILSRCDRLTLQTLNSDNVAPMYKKMGYATGFERVLAWASL